MAFQTVNEKTLVCKVTGPTAAMPGEVRPETVLPLSRASQLAPINVKISQTNHFGAASDSDLAATLHEHAEQIAYQVRRVIEDEHRRSAVV